ncbi:MAG TPA: autotransporter assembly complex family protein [Bauldia sp.]|nr:autotransporter assembly complex family protein [Bauldia sp.]
MRRASAGRAVIALALALAVGVGSVTPSFGIWPFTRRDRDEVPDPLPYTVEFTFIGGTRSEQRRIRSSSNLHALRREPPSGIVGLLARARSDVGRLTAALYREALYAGEIAITVDGRPLESFNPFDTVSARPVPIHVTVTTGEPFYFGAIQAAPLPPGVSLEKLGLVSGGLADSDTIVAAETAIANGWRRVGHPLAEVTQRDIVADHRSRILDVSLRVEPGPAADFGRIEIVGTDRVEPILVRRRAGIEPGRIYSSDITGRAERRLRDLGVFESVRVITGDSLDPDGTIPITIEVSEAKRRVIGFGVNYDNVYGLGANVYWMHRNLFGGAERLRFDASVSRVFEGDLTDSDYSLATTFWKPAVIGAMTDFTLRGAYYRDTTDAYRVTAAEVETGLTQEFSDTLAGGLSFEIQQADVEDAVQVADQYLIATLKGSLDWDRRDNKLDPTTGFRNFFSAAPAYDFNQENAFATFSNDFSIYRAIDADRRFVLAGRVQGAVITADSIRDVPPYDRLYAGGPGTVRGYAYQSLAPKNRKGDLIGGKSLFAASAELRYRVSNSLGVVAFVDAGNAYASLWPEIDNLKFGLGGGVRYLTPVGPLRVDLAFPLEPDKDDSWVALYVGLGQAF